MTFLKRILVLGLCLGLAACTSPTGGLLVGHAEQAPAAAPLAAV